MRKLPQPALLFRGGFASSETSSPAVGLTRFPLSRSLEAYPVGLLRGNRFDIGCSKHRAGVSRTVAIAAILEVSHSGPGNHISDPVRLGPGPGPGADLLLHQAELLDGSSALIQLRITAQCPFPNTLSARRYQSDSDVRQGQGSGMTYSDSSVAEGHIPHQPHNPSLKTNHRPFPSPPHYPHNPITPIALPSKEQASSIHP